MGGDEEPEAAARPLPHLQAAQSDSDGRLGLSMHQALAQGHTRATTSSPRESREQGLSWPPVCG